MIDQLSAEQRATLAALWEARAISERGVATVMATLVTQLTAAAADAAVIALAIRAAADELAHAEACRRLASAYLGADVPTALPRPVELTRDPTLDDRQNTTLHVVNLCCIGETIAAAFVETCLQHCEAAVIRGVHRNHLADEVVHARIGWAHLASTAVSDDDRGLIAARLPNLLAVQLAAWESQIAKLPVDGIAGHGYPPRAEVAATVAAAVETLVIPGLAYVGIDVGPASAWLAQRAT
ncbi:MAG: hypothetical protein NT062_03545 [Proteobacteria bacterium]|nr:hypothetical protein [Pseudomonadota bacterium]